MNIEKIKLSDSLTIYKSKYDWKYSQDELVEKTKQNHILIGNNDYTTSAFHIQSNAINHVKEYGRKLVMKLMNIESDNLDTWVEQHWIYYSNNTTTQPKSALTFHSHPITLTTTTSTPIPNIKTNWTYCFYLKVPTDLSGDEGKLMFRDFNNNEFGILPETGDIILFGPNDLHVPNFIPNSNEERIAICSNVSLNVHTYKKETTLL